MKNYFLINWKKKIIRTKSVLGYGYHDDNRTQFEIIFRNKNFYYYRIINWLNENGFNYEEIEREHRDPYIRIDLDDNNYDIEVWGNMENN